MIRVLASYYSDPCCSIKTTPQTIHKICKKTRQSNLQNIHIYALSRLIELSSTIQILVHDMNNRM